jgi:hypothetical protein
MVISGVAGGLKAVKELLIRIIPIANITKDIASNTYEVRNFNPIEFASHL